MSDAESTLHTALSIAFPIAVVLALMFVFAFGLRAMLAWFDRACRRKDERERAARPASAVDRVVEAAIEWAREQDAADETDETGDALLDAVREMTEAEQRVSTREAAEQPTPAPREERGAP